jgi:hypothetical protein
MNESSQTPAAQPVRTYFAPPDRLDKSEVLTMSRFVEDNPLFQAILESIDGYLMILNPERQVLAINKHLLTDLKIETPECLVGDRPGEILGCIHANEGPGGCGTSMACSSCGAVISILASQTTGQPETGECLATVRHEGKTDSLEFRVRATPVTVGGNHYTVLVFNDISGEKRRGALERTFFHDIMNTVGGLMGWSSLMQSLDDLDPKEVAERILILSKRLKQEIEDQRRLSQAESGALSLSLDTLLAQEILESLKLIFQAHEAAKGKHVEFLNTDLDAELTTDPSLLLRVLTNMIKNALEASAEGDTVRVWHEWAAGHHRFCVQNPAVIPGEIALRIFQRSFSTKAAKGRGIGTYSMKLFGERYLGGQVDFASTPEQGTVFWIQMPGTIMDQATA